LRALLVVAHPLDNAFVKAAAERIRVMLERRGIEVDMIDLYADDFDPRLTRAERRRYFTTPYDSRAAAGYVARLMLAEKLVFVFPQWWFNVPAILKGFFDRVLVPGVAFDHPSGGGPLIPRLTHVNALWVVSSTGAPWWVTRLYMGDPVRRQIARGIKPLVGRKAKDRRGAAGGERGQRPDLDPVALSIEAKVRRAGKGKRLVIGNGAETEVNAGLVELIKEAFAIRNQFLSGSHDSIEAMSGRLGMNKGRLTSLVRLSYLGPEIVRAPISASFRLSSVTTSSTRQRATRAWPPA
jgi:NAD(P)H dehydrogenase (quinone)